jgi:hypothetical protein
MKPMKEPKLKLTPAPTFMGDQEIRAHGDAPSLMLKLEYRHMSKSAARDWIAGLKDSQRPAAETLLDIVASVQDEAGVKVAASAHIFSDLMENYPAPFADIVTAWSDHLMKGREKN